MKKLFTILLLFIAFVGFSQQKPVEFRYPVKFTGTSEKAVDSLYGFTSDGVMGWIKKSDILSIPSLDATRLVNNEVTGKITGSEIFPDPSPADFAQYGKVDDMIIAAIEGISVPATEETRQVNNVLQGDFRFSGLGSNIGFKTDNAPIPEVRNGQKLAFADFGAYMLYTTYSENDFNPSSNTYTSTRFDANGIVFYELQPNAVGINSQQDFTGNYPTDGSEDLIFPQIKYVKQFVQGNNTLSATSISMTCPNAVNYYASTGTTPTFTLPPIAGNEGKTIIVVNKGTGTMNIESATGDQDIWEAGGTQFTLPLVIGAYYYFRNDGVHWTDISY